MTALKRWVRWFFVSAPETDDPYELPFLMLVFGAVVGAAVLIGVCVATAWLMPLIEASR